MTKLIHSQAKDIYPITALMSDKSLDKLNDIAKVVSGIKYKRQRIEQMAVTVKRIKPVESVDKGVSKFFKRLMEAKPGFDKGDR